MRLIRLGAAIILGGLVGCGSSAPSKPVYTTRTAPPTTSAAKPETVAAVTPKAAPVAPPTPEAKPPELPPDREVRPPEVEEKEPEPELPPPIPTGAVVLNKARTIMLEVPKNGPRKVHILAEVCLREGPLEVFLCKARTKEHESILAADFDARDLHTALVTAKANPGSPVQFFNQKTMKEEFRPATGSKIRITLTYNLGGKPTTAIAQEWIRDAKTKKDMTHEWVFAGSRLFKNPEDPLAPDYYCANNGEVISISNFIDAMLDLPVKSPRESAALAFESNPTKIPPKGTKVLVTLEVVPPK